MDNQDAIRESDLMDGLSIRFLKIFGMWNVVNTYRTTGKTSAVVKIHVIVTLAIVLPYVVCQLQSFFYIKYDLQKFTYIFLHQLAAFSLCCKTMIIWFRIESVTRLYNLMRNDFLNIPDNIRAEAEQIYKKISRMSNLCCFFAFLTQSLLEIIYLCFPGTPVDYIQYHTGPLSAVKTGRNKMFGGWYPVPMGETPYYELIFAFEVIALLWIATLLAYSFNVFFQLLMCLYAQFAVFKFRLANLKVDSSGYSTRKNNKHRIKRNDKIHEELREIFLDHQKLLKYTDELRSVFNPMVTLTLGIGVVALISGGLQMLLGKSSDTIFLLRIAQVFVYEFMEVSMFCLGSSFIETESMELQFAIYCSDWYKADVMFRRDAQMLMIRSRRSCTLTAVVMYPVNLETLGSLCQFTYSTIALAMNNI